jgi:NAD-dependent dihydropyrimidine dehydrogenase PreA subunit
VRVDAQSCTGCEQCVPYCPMGAIRIDGIAIIDEDECVECGVCRRSRVCPADSFYQPTLSWPRQIRAMLSDQTYRAPGAAPRSSGGMKIGDVTGRYRPGEATVMVELGRPSIGARFRDLEVVTQALAVHGYRVSHGRSVARFMADPATGRVKDDVRNEKASRIGVQYVVPVGQVAALWQSLREIASQVNTVISVGVTRRFEADGSLSDLSVPAYPNGKINVGLGQPRAEEAEA